MTDKLSPDSEQLLSSLPAGQRDRVREHLEKLEEKLAQHSAASRALVMADERGGACGGSTDWSDIELALEFARTALGPEECAKIKAEVHEAEGADSDEDSDEDDED